MFWISFISCYPWIHGDCRQLRFGYQKRASPAWEMVSILPPYFCQQQRRPWKFRDLVENLQQACNGPFVYRNTDKFVTFRIQQCRSGLGATWPYCPINIFIFLGWCTVLQCNVRMDYISQIRSELCRLQQGGWFSDWIEQYWLIGILAIIELLLFFNLIQYYDLP